MSIFDEISKLRKSGKEPYQWYRNRIKELGTPSQAQLIRDGKITGRVNFGALNMFIYDPKLKNKLPYYDTFPLVLPIERYRDGFLGINFHYLPYALRARLLSRLDPNANYSALKNVKLVKPTLKRYLNTNVRSRFRKLEEEDFMTAIMLPVQRFRKSSASKVWSDSRKAI
ncbi:MAG: hypothetical protein CMD48_02640 [Gammaproteobacteria bacterium]|jgi:hypothetical protein|nr:hypothetical protein [Gammaproteobacteria bacterium]|tara:strand:- start:620 stop:1129 length:510 start_codon:yes stop_codon:yes gene_type:complete